MHLKRREFTISLYRDGYHESPEQPPPTLDLPASPEQLRDLLDQARVNNPSQAYAVEVTFCYHQYLFDHLDGQRLDLIELNHLADRLADLDGHGDDAFHVPVQMDSEPLSLERLINMTHSTNDVAIAYGVFSDYSLGKWSYENDLIDDLIDIPGNVAKYLDFAKIGAERRNDEHGIHILCSLESLHSQT